MACVAALSSETTWPRLALDAVCGSICIQTTALSTGWLGCRAAYVRVTAGTHGQLKSSLIKE